MTGRHEHPYPHYRGRHSKFITPKLNDIGDEPSFGMKHDDKARVALRGLVTQPGQHRGIEAGAHKADKKDNLLAVTARRVGRNAVRSLQEAPSPIPDISELA